jgi:drug/metabolite transporter (DMT)-like permease
MNQKLGGHLAIISANVIFGASIPITKSLLDTWITPEAYTVLRLVFGAVIFWSIGIFSKKEKVTNKDLLVIGIGGIFGFIATQLLFAIALQYTTPVYFSLLMSLTPVLVLFLSFIFLKELLNRNKVIGVILSIAGAAIIILCGKSGGMAENNMLGIILAFLAALSYAIYIIITRNISKKYSPITLTKWTFLLSAALLVPFGITDLPSQKIFQGDVPVIPIMQLGYALIFATAIGFLLMPVGLKRLKATTVSIYINFLPIVASIIAIIIGQDLFSWDKPIAAILVISGVIMVSRKPSEMKKSNVKKKGSALSYKYEYQN